MVLAVISLLAGLALPRYSSAAIRYRLKAAAHRMGTDIAMARNAARARSSAITMKFNTGTSGNYTISDVAPINGNAGEYSVSLASDQYRVTLARVDFEGSTTLIFNGFGVGASGEVELTASGWACIVMVDGITGVVRIVGP